MPNVVSILSKEDHIALKARAKSNRRTLGAQLAYEAFQSIGLAAPSYIAEPQERRPTFRKRNRISRGQLIEKGASK